MSFLLSYTLGHAVDHVSGLNIGGEQRPVLPVTIGDEASIDRALSFEKGDALFDVRHRFVVSFGAELPTPRNLGRAVEYLAGGWQLNGIVQATDRLPDHRVRSVAEHPVPDQPAESGLRPECRRAGHDRLVVRHLVLRAPLLAGNG